MNVLRIVLITGLLNAGLLIGQNTRVGDWKNYLSHRQALKSVAKDRTIYAISSGGMFAYDIDTRESRAYSTIEGLSGINPTALHYDPVSDQVFVGYESGMIDFFVEPTQIQYFTDIARNNSFTQKRINDFTSLDEKLYIATDFGLVIYDLQTGLPETDITQFANNPNRLAVTHVSVFEEKVWVLVDGVGLYSAPIDFPNLKDPAIWTSEAGQNGLPMSADVLQIEGSSQRLLARLDTTVLMKSIGQDWAINSDWDAKWDFIEVSETAISAGRVTRIRARQDNGPSFNFFLKSGVRHCQVVEEDLFYVATAGQGVQEFNAWETSSVSPEGPQTNDCIRIAAGNGELYIAPKGYNQALTPDPSALGIYYYRRGAGWTILNRANDNLDSTVSTGFARATYDPNSGVAYLGSWGAGMVSLQQGQQLDFSNCEDGLSIINPPCNPNNLGNTRISGMDLDPNGYLWVSLAFAQTPVMVRTPDGQWLSGNAQIIPPNDHLIGLMADSYGNKWLINKESGLVVYNDNGTPEQIEDDWTLSLRTGAKQGNLPTNVVESIARDQDDFVWVGTTQGVVVYYEPFAIAQRQVVDAQPPVFDRRPLLKETVVRAIAVDGGNRKWFGTNDGVFLVSPEGDELIHHFTTENSPLLSNTVNDIAVDGQTGEVFFATNLGLISYQGDATTAASTCEDVLVYPNPVFTDYDGPITIRGAAANAKVKITSVSGLLVKEIEAQGGTAVWDGRDLYGRQVRSGVYLALIADDNGENGCIGKFTVIAR